MSDDMNMPPSPQRWYQDRTILARIIGGVFAVIVALIPFVVPAWFGSDHAQHQDSTKAVAINGERRDSLKLVHRADSTISGRVVDQMTNLPVPGATVNLVGAEHEEKTANDGNFQFSLGPNTSETGQLRLKVIHPNFFPIELSVQLPTTNLVIPMRRR
jgi:hypothetical protein